VGKALLSAKAKRRIRAWFRRFVVWVGALVWRFRAGLTPVWCGLGVCAIGWALAAWPDLAPLPALTACLVAAGVWFGGEQLSPRVQRAWLILVPASVDAGRKGVLDRPTERGFLALLLLACGAWLACRMRYGLIEPLGWGLIALTVALGAPWWWHRGWRRKRPMNPWARRWARVNENDDLRVWHKSKIVEVTGTVEVTTLRVRLRRGLTIKHVGRDSLILDSALGLRGGATSVALYEGLAHDVLVRVVPRDPWTAPIPHPLPALRSLSLADTPRVPVGKFEDATDSMLKIRQHMLVVGASGSGKSEFLQSLLAWIFGFDNAVVVAADLAGGATFDVWEPTLAAPLATTVPDAFELLWQVFRLIEHRERKLAARRRAGERINVLPTSAEEPAVWFVIDEFPDLVAGAKMETGPDGEKLGVMAILERIAKKARKANVWLVLAAQNPGVDDVGSTTLRGQLTATIGLGLDQRQSMTLWGTLRQQGWDSESLAVGSYLLRDRNDPDHRAPRVAKGVWLSEDERAKLIDRVAIRPGILSGEEARIIPTHHTVIPAIPTGETPPPAVERFPQPRRLTVVRDGDTPNPAPIPAPPSPAKPGMEPRVKAGDLDERILGELPERHQGGVGASGIATQLGVDRGVVERALRRLEAAGEVFHTGKRGGWARA
jgi:hypothetical protein